MPMGQFVSTEKLIAAITEQMHHKGDQCGPAVFDADHTLWNADVGALAFQHAIQHDLFHQDVVEEPFWQWAKPYGLDASMGFRSALERIQEEEFSGQWLERGKKLNLEPWEVLSQLYQMQAWIFAGYTRQELCALGRQLFFATLEPLCFSYVPDVFALLQKHGVAIHIITASQGYIAEGALKEMGISPSNVYGMAPALQENDVALPRLSRISYGPGKRQCIEHELRVKPFLAFGDSVATGDAAMFDTAELAVAVYPKGQHLEAAKTRQRCLILEETHAP